MTKKLLLTPLFIFFLTTCDTSEDDPSPVNGLQHFAADDNRILYTGRFDFDAPKKPRVWAPGAYITARFKGPSLDILINDQVLNGNTHNYLQIKIDDQQPFRIQTTSAMDTIRVADNLSSEEHTVMICKNTEANIGYIEFAGFITDALMSPPAKPDKKIEFIGNSITSGMGSDMTAIRCNEGEWYDQHNAYLSYGPIVARELDAQWHLTSYSGIGLIRSCCNIGFTMPDVYDRLSLTPNSKQWDFTKYTPDLVTICLGQNDGIQDSTHFTEAYVSFIGGIRERYPQADIITLTSPMADASLAASQKNYLTGIVDYLHNSGDQKIHKFFFSKNWTGGCGAHPNVQEHQEIAEELTAFIKSTLGW